MKKRFGRIMAALLSMVMVVGMVPLNAFAWGTEGQVCSSKFGDAYVGFDGENYYSASSIDFIAYDDDGNTTKHTKAGGNVRRKYMIVEADGSEHHVYCIESGIDFGSSTNEYTSTSGKNSRYFQNLPKAAREGIMLTTVYGWQEGKHTPVAGTSDDDYALATQVIIWEYQQQLRTSPTRISANSHGIPADSYLKTIKGRPAEKCYDWILEQMANHLVAPSFSGKTHFLTPDGDYKIELLAGFVSKSTGKVYNTELSCETLDEFRSISTFEGASGQVDTSTYITLSTCSYEYENARYVVIGRIAPIL